MVLAAIPEVSARVRVRANSAIQGWWVKPLDSFTLGNWVKPG